MSGCGGVGFGQQKVWPQFGQQQAAKAGQKQGAEQAGQVQQQAQGSQAANGTGKGEKNIDMETLMAAAEIQASNIRAGLLARDSEVRAHEAAHQAAAGPIAGQAQFDMATKSIPKPDGTTETVSYAAGGSVPISMPGVPKTPPKTAEGRAELDNVRALLQLAQAGAEAPGANEMSGADAAVAGAAAAGQATVDALQSQADAQPPKAERVNPFAGAMLNPLKRS